MFNFLKPKKPSSYDVVGDIIILNKKISKRSAKQLLKENKHVKTILFKTNKYQGKFRTPTLKHILGEKKKTTLHKENNITLKLDVEKCYFSQRTATERLRIAKLVKKEDILVMFSGIAPFPLVIEKNSSPKSITAIEINPIAHKYAQENLKLNKSKKITLIKGDVTKELPKLKKFNRIILPLPKTAKDYLELAKTHLKPKGTIHLYLFDEEKNIEKLKTTYKTKKITKCGQYAPRIYRLCLDLKPLIS
tara:strand:+ start:816 stop:1559 length:744 start_codon:yes stop_codon:yes gene_type:complete